MLTYSRLLPAFRLPQMTATIALAVLFLIAAERRALAADPPPSDSVTLANGDHLSGSVTQIDGGKLTLHTDYGGDIVIDFAKIASVKLQKSAVLSQMKTEGKKVDISKIEVVGIENKGKEVEVTTQAGATQTVPAPPTVRTPAAQAAFEETLHPNWAHGWTTTANVSFALARGNSNTTTLGTGDTAVRQTLHDKTGLYYNEIFTHDGIANLTTANNINAGARYDHNLAPKIFAYGAGDFFEDQLQELDLRAILGGGIGWHAIAKPRRTLDVTGGLAWTHEKYSSIASTLTPPTTNNYLALTAGEAFMQKLGAASIFTEQVNVLPDMNDLGQLNANGGVGLSTKIHSFLSWQFNATDVYVSNPPAGTKTNDLIVTTGLGFTFTRK